MRQRICISLGLAALLALLPLCAAGTADDPEILDDALDAGPGNAWGDIRAGWVEQPDAATLRFHVELTATPALHVGNALGVVFDVDGASYYAALFHEMESDFAAGRFDRDSFSPASDMPIKGSIELGAPGRLTLDVPMALFSPEPAMLTRLSAFAVEVKTAFVLDEVVVLDEGVASRDFALAARDEPPEAAAAPGDASTAGPAAPPAEAVQPAATAPDADEPPSRAVPFPSPALLLALLPVLGRLAPRR